jgi:hypothetical protein
VEELAKTKWVAALRSGKYRQGTGRLRTKDGGYCCLGVLCEAVGKPIASDGVFPARENDCSSLSKLIGVNIKEFIRMNDREWLTFEQIAEWIEVNVSVDGGR